MRSRTRTPYRFTVPAAAAGLVAGWLMGLLVGWEPLFCAIGVCLLAQVAADAWWATERQRRR
jgi:hypothetical protein